MYDALYELECVTCFDMFIFKAYDLATDSYTSLSEEEKKYLSRLECFGAVYEKDAYAANYDHVNSDVYVLVKGMDADYADNIESLTGRQIVTAFNHSNFFMNCS